MVNQQLLQYIVQQEHAGYSEKQITDMLLKNGYAKKDIKAAFKAAHPGKPDTVVHDYVEQYARVGYTGPQVFDVLQKQGFSAKVIRKAIKEVYGAGLAPDDIPHTHIFVFSILALVVGAASMYLVIAFFGGGDDTGTGVTGQPVVTFEPQVIINDIVEVTRRDGKEAGITQCQERLLHTNRDMCLQAIAVMREVEDYSICEMIVNADIHDSCYVNFLNQDFEGVCQKVKLAKTKETCESLRLLRG